MRTCLVDNYDSYTFNLAQLAARVYGVAPVVVPNDSPRLDAEFLDGFDAVLLSPGPGRVQCPRDVGRAPTAVRGTRAPVLGVCLGHQALAHLSGADVGAAPAPRHGSLSRLSHAGTGLFTGLPQGFEVVRYHSHCVRTPLPEDLVADAWAEDGVVMALHHVRERWWGVQFHPESVGSRFGAELLANFRSLVGAGPAWVAPGVGQGRPLRAGPAESLPVELRAADGAAPEGTGPLEGSEITVAGDAFAGDWALTVEPVAAEPDAAWVFERVCAGRSHAFWLDSARVMPGYSRFSYLGFPGGAHGEVLRYRAEDRRVRVLRTSGTESSGTGPPVGERVGRASHVASGARGAEREDSVPGSIFDVLSQRLRGRRLTGGREFPFALRGGYVGYLGYEARAECGSPVRHRSPVPDAVYVSATRYVVIDHVAHRAWVVAAHPVRDPGDDAGQWVRDTARLLRAGGRAATAAASSVLPAGTDPERWLGRSREEYVGDIRRCLDALRAGESYEICLTNELTVPFDGDPFAAYLAQRERNPAPYAALLRFGDLAVLSSSPERFLTVSPDGVAESKPIKGTAARDEDPAADRAARDCLLECPKTFAENLMIVDLVRNDLGRVCETGSVTVPSLMAVESYASVHQLVSTVRGALRPGVDAVTATRACFPGGSMTGAPKLRTMEIIDDLERRPRGVYSGAIGYFGLDGAADLSIVIRTAVIHDGVLRAGAGGAIVLDSDPDAEYEEALVKLVSCLPGGPAVQPPHPSHGDPAPETATPPSGGPASPGAPAGAVEPWAGAHSTER